MGKIARYVLEIVDSLLGPGQREKRFDWALGDISPKTGRAARLPFDAVWMARKLIVEVDEDQHHEATAFFDKPDRITVSNVHRGQQRALYDARKRQAAREQGYLVVALAWPRRRRPAAADIDEIRAVLIGAGVNVGHATVPRP